MASSGGETSGAIVHIRADSDSTLEDLFDVVHKPQGSKRPLQVPLRMRNLPESFFRQPNFGSSSHSREPSNETLPEIRHSRTHSSPATLGGGGVAYELVSSSSPSPSSPSSSSSLDLHDPLPPGWEIAKTPQGQLYYMNHIMKTTQWEDPRKQIHQLMLQQMNRSSQSRNYGDPNEPLPLGWDQSETPEGEMYFINHSTKKTTWFDPRIPIHHQRVPIRQNDSKRQSDLRLARLENERRAIQVRQAEIKRSMMSMRQHQEAMQQTQELLLRHNLNEPPFSSLGSELHNRQESADSGLGMGSNFNLGSIPEDMTTSMELDLDSSVSTTSPTAPQSVSTTTPDMDSLLPSLSRDIGEEISVMQDVHSLLENNNKGVDNLTWL